MTPSQTSTVEFLIEVASIVHQSLHDAICTREACADNCLNLGREIDDACREFDMGAYLHPSEREDPPPWPFDEPLESIMDLDTWEEI